MRWVFFIILVLVAAILDAGNLLNLIAFNQGQIRPGILVILLVFFSMRSQPEQAIVFAFVIGFAADLAGPVMGPHTVCCGLAGSLLSQTQGLLTIKRPVYQLLVTFPTALLVSLFAHWLAMVKTSQTAALSLPVLTGCALYTAAAAPILWPLLNLFYKYLINPLSGRTTRSRIGYV